MYLSNRDTKWAIDNERLICTPRPEDLGRGTTRRRSIFTWTTSRKPTSGTSPHFRNPRTPAAGAHRSYTSGGSTGAVSPRNTSFPHLKTRRSWSIGEAQRSSSSPTASCSGRPKSASGRLSGTLVSFASWTAKAPAPGRASSSTSRRRRFTPGGVARSSWKSPTSAPSISC